MSNFNDGVIAGALFDFLGFLTGREESISLGATELATPAADLLAQFAKTRGLKIDEARVSDWQAALSQQEAEPVAYQCRMRASWNSDQLWTKWEECSKGTFEDYKRAPTNSDWYFESRALYEHPPKPAALPQPEREQFSWEREREQPVASVPQDSEDSFERWVNTHPGYTYRDVWQAGREYQSWLSVASVPQDVEEFIKNSSDKGIWFHDQKVVPVDALRTLVDGKALVPVEPTREMIARTVDAVFDGAIEDENIISEIYSAMLTASKEGA